LFEGQPDLGNGGVEVGSVVLDHGRRDEAATVKVGEQELGADLVAVEADDAKMFGTDLLNAGMEHAARLAHRGGNAGARRTPSGTSNGHEMNLHNKRLGSSHFGRWLRN